MRYHYVLLAAVIVLFATQARAQQHHAAGHNEYQNWSSEKTANCCNNEDCGDLKDDQWRETDHGDEIKILGQWCPVKREHYLTKGKSPDWNVAHACVNQNPNASYANPCDRLLCFTGKGGW